MTTLRPLSDVCVVRLLERQSYSDLIAIPDSVAENQPLQKAVIVRVGPGRDKIIKAGSTKTKFVPTMVKPGDHVVFYTAILGTRQGKALGHVMEDGEAIIREEDILFAFDGDLKVEAV